MLTLETHHRQHGAAWDAWDALEVLAHFGDSAAEYAAASQTVVLHDRRDRGVLEIRGQDRATWLHNLTTNEVKNLRSGDGNYLFAINVLGRVLFDANVVVMDDALLLDVDRRWVTGALAHLNKFVIVEDVQLSDRSGDFERLALVGPQVAAVASTWGSTNVMAMAELQHEVVCINGTDCRMVRHDFTGVPAVELIVPAPQALNLWRHLCTAVTAQGGCPAGVQALQIQRIEAGTPWSCQDIDNEVLPAETRQLERAVSFQKGCYLGQEVVERMRAHQSVARVLVGLTLAGDAAAAGARLERDAKAVGRVTSAVHSSKLGRRIGLGYVKTALADPGTELSAVTDRDAVPCRVEHLPFTG